MLQNRIYRGEIVHKGKSYRGEHQAIIDETLWKEVQDRLAANRFDRVTGVKAAQPSMLAGLIYDDAGERMTPTHANKKGTRYRYYVSRGLVQGDRRSAPAGRRVPAGDIEILVETRLRQFFETDAAVFAAVESPSRGPTESVDLVARAAELAHRWPELGPTDKRAILTAVVERIDLKPETIDIHILPSRLPSILIGKMDTRNCTQPEDGSKRTVTLTVHAQLKRAGKETRLLIDAADGGARRKLDRSLYRILAQAFQYNAMMMQNNGKTMAQLGAQVGVGGSYFSRILRLSFLAPEIVRAILRDRHPIELTAKRLAYRVHLPIQWDAQRLLLISN
jgi:hypothetical protein